MPWMRTSVRFSYNAASTAATDGSRMRASAERKTVTGSLEWSATSAAATSVGEPAFALGARRCRRPIRALRCSVEIRGAICATDLPHAA